MLPALIVETLFPALFKGALAAVLIKATTAVLKGAKTIAESWIVEIVMTYMREREDRANRIYEGDFDVVQGSDSPVQNVIYLPYLK